MNLERLENELKKRLQYPYSWGRKQNNYYDGLTNFIYEIESFDELSEVIKRNFSDKSDYDNFLNYALNRWFNFWSAKGVEEIFCSSSNVKAEKNKRDKIVDFYIDDISFDHKTSIFPKGYNVTFEDALSNPGDLCKWLYENQSQEQRKHLKNRLFIVLYAKDGEHWKLKAEISLLKSKVEDYVKNFNQNNLIKITLEEESITLSDIIWMIK
ncbi:MAG: hypothetical protein V1781_03160 [Bacteroidota bacterium]